MAPAVSIALAVMLVMTSAAGAADEPSFAAAAAKSAEQFNSGQGGQYGIAFMKSAGKALISVAQACKDGAVPVGAFHDIIFIVSASGGIEQIIHGQRNAYGDCVTSHLHMLASVAKPPGDSWPIQIRFLHGSLREGDHPAFLVISDGAGAVASPPPDKPSHVAGQEQIDRLLEAEKPYIAKGRATYPAAKKRYLAGLPQRCTFTVRKRLADPGDERYEEVFVYVDAIKDGKVFGRIASELDAVRSYRQGQHISFPESEVLDWTISRPDGSEDGNYVGKFIDNYNPQ